MRRRDWLFVATTVAVAVVAICVSGCELNVLSDDDHSDNSDNSNQGNVTEEVAEEATSNLVTGVWIVTPTDEQMKLDGGLLIGGGL